LIIHFFHLFMMDSRIVYRILAKLFINLEILRKIKCFY
jgi:hypothetical protein